MGDGKHSEPFEECKGYQLTSGWVLSFLLLSQPLALHWGDPRGERMTAKDGDRSFFSVARPNGKIYHHTSSPDFIHTSNRIGCHRPKQIILIFASRMRAAEGNLYPVQMEDTGAYILNYQISLYLSSSR